MSEQKRDYLNESLTWIRKREVQKAFDDGIEAGMRRAAELSKRNHDAHPVDEWDYGYQAAVTSIAAAIEAATGKGEGK